ncbi:MAG: oxidoreductase [Spirochaetaceae bacterium]|jgi:nitrogenase molybdenum-iron protein alpha/beta subunit|nr:oxidoreductase [Spirochaetaceae bacterium]
MNFCSENISPDGFTGALFAIEGIRDACTILNGPTGCKFYHSAISDSQFFRSPTYDPLEYTEGFYFGQSRIPSTYLDGEDYIFGSGEKLSSILKSVVKKQYRLIAVVNSPGAALIGDDLEDFLDREVRAGGPGAEIPCFALENSGYSTGFGQGYQNALLKALDALLRSPAPDAPPGEPEPGRPEKPAAVNLLGLCIYQKYYDQNYQALKRLLGLCGITVIAAPGAGDPAAAITRMGEAALNVVVYPEYGRSIAEKMKARYGIPFLCLEEGPPIGFDAAAAFVNQVCAALGRDGAAAAEAIDGARARAYLYLSRFSSLLGLPKGTLFSVKAEASTAYALTRWLCSYLGMIPAAVSLLPSPDPGFAQKLETFLVDIHYREALEKPAAETPTHILLADGNTIAELKLREQQFCGIEIALPSLGYIDVSPKSLFGEQGALFLLEQILNGLRFTLA